MTELPAKKLSGSETIKRESNYLRGTVSAELDDASTNEVSDAAYELLKFHGSYFGYNRDSATERKKAGLDKEYEFMIRLKMPGGVLRAEQYLALDKSCDYFANGTLRITTRETFQFHNIIKGDFKPFIRDINAALLSTIAGCGDVVRNIMTSPAPIKDRVHQQLQEATFTLARELAPKSSAYYDIFLDGEPIAAYPFNPTPNDSDVPEPLYGETYMPRKFKISVSVPDDNSMDALSHDLAFIGVVENGAIIGYNIFMGGGFGMKHNNPKTYPRLASPIAYIPESELVRAAKAVVMLQRDHGDRSDRQHARLKYVVQENGLAWTRSELEKYFGSEMKNPLLMPEFKVPDHMGWHAQGDGKFWLGVPVPSGRIAGNLRIALREVIEQYRMELRLTADQNILLCDLSEADRAPIEQKLRAHGVALAQDITSLDRNFLACVALPTCGKALAEAERVRNPLVVDIESVMEAHGIKQDKIAVRIAGCPNGCSRPYVGDVGIVGRTPGTYALFIGGDFEGTRLNTQVFDKVPQDDIKIALSPMFKKYAAERSNAAEGFGDFCLRVGVENVKKAAVDVLAADYKWAA